MITLIDIGSNTVKLDVYRLKNEKSVLKKIKPIKLAMYKSSGYLERAGIDALVGVLHEFKREARGDIYPFATASLRGISNASEVTWEVFEKTGLKIDIISGEEEARYDLIGLSKTKKYPYGLMIDLGGGSTELVSFHGNTAQKLNSFSFGALSMKCEFNIGDIPTPEDDACIYEKLLAEIRPSVFGSGVYTHAILIGGTAKGMFSLYNAKNRYGFKKSVLNLKELQHLYRWLTVPENYTLVQEVTPDRADTILTGISCYHALFKILGCNKISLCKNGVREGYLEKVKMQRKGADQTDV